MFDVGGKFESKADLSFNSLDVGGMASISGNGKGSKWTLEDSCESPEASTRERSRHWGRAYIGALLRLDSLDVGGSMEADQIIARKASRWEEISRRSREQKETPSSWDAGPEQAAQSSLAQFASDMVAR